jgi:hypothetical protein
VTVTAGGVLNVCEPLLAVKVLNGSSSDYAVLAGSFGIGMVAASLYVMRRGAMPDSVLVRRYLAALAVASIGMLAGAAAANIWMATVAFAATGYANALMLVSETQFLQLRVPAGVQGRLFGAKDALEGACFLGALVLAGALVTAAGVRFTLAVAAGICAAAATAAAILLRSEAWSGSRTQALAGDSIYAASGRSVGGVGVAAGGSASARSVGVETTSNTA